MAAIGVLFVTISLVVPDNPLLAGAVSAARRKGLILVAAVGNDGPAAPTAFPDSYDGVFSATSVEGRNSQRIEAGRQRRIDYSSQGAHMVSAHTNRKDSLVQNDSQPRGENWCP